MGTSGAPRALLMDASDNVAVAAAVLEPGEEIELGGRRISVGERIPFGHKLALEPIAEGGHVIKYGEVIGVATEPIPAGNHVHVQNVVSARLPGR